MTSVCWWCCHPPGVMGLPTRYNKHSDTFDVYGTFCSFQCAKAYNFADAGSNQCARMSLISLMRQKTTGDYSPVICAPPRQSLSMFGGPMTIDEFRRCKDKCQVTMVPVVPVEYIVEKQTNFKFKKQDSQDTAKPEIKSSSLPVKSNKTQNPLEKVLGIFPT